jgi:hypothetical protein
VCTCVLVAIQTFVTAGSFTLPFAQQITVTKTCHTRSLPTPSTSSPTPTPTTRSRTLLFISYRDSSSRAPRRPRAARRQYEEAYQPSDENEGLIDHQAMPHTSLDVELPPKWFVRSEWYIPEHFPFVCLFFFALLKKKKNRVDYVEQVEEILAATQAKGARLFRRPKMSASVDRCVMSHG